MRRVSFLFLIFSVIFSYNAVSLDASSENLKFDLGGLNGSPDENLWDSSILRDLGLGLDSLPSFNDFSPLLEPLLQPPPVHQDEPPDPPQPEPRRLVIRIPAELVRNYIQTPPVPWAQEFEGVSLEQRKKAWEYFYRQSRKTEGWVLRGRTDVSLHLKRLRLFESGEIMTKQELLGSDRSITPALFRYKDIGFLESCGIGHYKITALGHYALSLLVDLPEEITTTQSKKRAREKAEASNGEEIIDTDDNEDLSTRPKKTAQMSLLPNEEAFLELSGEQEEEVGDLDEQEAMLEPDDGEEMHDEEDDFEQHLENLLPEILGDPAFLATLKNQAASLICELVQPQIPWGVQPGPDFSSLVSQNIHISVVKRDGL